MYIFPDQHWLLKGNTNTELLKTASSNHNLEQEAFSRWEEENRGVITVYGLRRGIEREETIHCGLIRGNKVNYTGKPRGSCKAPVEEEQPPRMTPSYTRCLPRQKMWLPLEFHRNIHILASGHKVTRNALEIRVFRLGAEKGAELQDELKLDLIWRLTMTFLNCNWWLDILKFRRRQTSNGLNTK